MQKFKVGKNRAGNLVIWDPSVQNVDCRKEFAEQIDLNNKCQMRFQDHYDSMWHTVNESGGKGTAHYGNRLTQQGRKAGVADWSVMVPSSGFHGLFVELKRLNKRCGGAKPEQNAFLKRQSDLGYACIIAHGHEAALYAIEHYLNGNWSDHIACD